MNIVSRKEAHEQAKRARDTGKDACVHRYDEHDLTVSVDAQTFTNCIKMAPASLQGASCVKNIRQEYYETQTSFPVLIS